MSAVTETRSLSGLLQKVDDRKLREVVRLVETSGQRSSLEPELAAMRCRLRRLRPQRPLTIQRLLTAPFEAALSAESNDVWTFVVHRGLLGRLHTAILDGLEPTVINETKALLYGRTVDDDGVVLEAGRQLWPLAADALAAASTAVPDMARQAWQRVADLMVIGPELVPLLRQLLPLPASLHPEDKELLGAILALAQGGSEDRLGTVMTVLVRAAPSPTAIAGDIAELGAETPATPVRALLNQVLAEQRASMARLIAAHAEAPDMPLAQAAEEAWRFAEALAAQNVHDTGRANERAEEDGLREQAATVAQSRYAAAIASLVASDSELDWDDRKAAVRAREEAARCCAKLGQAARRLKPTSSVSRITDEVVEKLVAASTAEARLAGPERAAETARLIEILAGPEVAWRYFREHQSGKSPDPVRQPTATRK